MQANSQIELLTLEIQVYRLNFAFEIFYDISSTIGGFKAIYQLNIV